MLLTLRKLMRLVTLLDWAGLLTTEFELTNTTDLTDIKFSCIIETNSFINI